MTRDEVFHIAYRVPLLDLEYKIRLYCCNTLP